MPSSHRSTPKGPPQGARPRDSGPERFRSGGEYAAQREWQRYEGTPQRELLRRIRERALLQALGTLEERNLPRLEIGPGPGRFTPLLAPPFAPLVLVDASVTMLREAARSVQDIPSSVRRAVHPIRADARWMPFAEPRFEAVVCLGNVVGFAEHEAERVLSNAARVVAGGGFLLVETVSPVREVPRGTQPLSPEDWGVWLEGDCEASIERLLSAGFASASPSKASPSKFRFLPPKTVRNHLEHAGLQVEDELLVAPFTGGSPEVVEAIVAQAPELMEPLIHWEEVAGRDGRLLNRGGHLLTLARRAARAP